MRVLVVEDDALARSEIQRALTTVNYGLQTELARRGVAYIPLSEKDIALANSRESALQELTSSKFDLVLLDLLLPYSSDTALPDQATLYGYEILNTVRSLSPDSEVIILSDNLRKEQHGLIEFENRLFSSEPTALPDDLLWKEAYRNIELLQRKIASYLVDLCEEDETKLRANGIYVPPAGMPSYTRKLLRTLKRISWNAEDGLPLPDIILMGERGSGKATFARAFHLLRSTPIDSGNRRLGFEHVDMGAIYDASTEDPLEVLTGNTSGERWSLGALPRGTFYMRGGTWLRLPGQEVQENKRSYTIGGVPNTRLYPHSSDQPNFSASGTVYLENPFTTDSKVNREIEQILGPDIDRRYVTTRGKPPVRLHIAPCVILGLTAGKAAVGSQNGTVDALPNPQIGQVLIPIRPLRERSREEKIWLLEVLVNRRRRLAKREGNPLNFDDAVRLENSMLRIVGERMYFRDNLDDLQAIAVQVLPEERSISWRHLRKLWERDKHLGQTCHSDDE